jgi:hypothetical protein
MSFRLHFLGAASSALLVTARVSAREVTEQGGTAASEDVEDRKSSRDEKFPLPDQGHLLITSGAQVSVAHTVSSYPEGSTRRTTNITLTPSLEYLVTDHLTVGARLYLGMTKSEDWGTSWVAGASPVIGYLIPLGGRLALWPKVGASYTYYSNEAGPGWRSIGIGALLPVVVHVAPNFFVGAGPHIAFSSWSSGGYEGRSSDLTTSFETMIGGWI